VDLTQTGSRPVREHGRRETLLALGGYALLSVLLFGLPVVGHLGSHFVAADPVDSSVFTWFYAWWPHAILHGLNPFVTHAMFVPTGFNMTWAAAMPGPSIVLAPVTETAGPVVTWNLIQLAAPALSAWTMFLLCRHVTSRTWPSLAGGYVFGFSPYMLLHLSGAPNLALVALVPVFVLLVLRRLGGTLGKREFVIAMALALTGQYLISAEVLVTSTLFGAIALVLAFALMPNRRTALIAVVRLLALAYVATAVLISPFLYFFLFGEHYPPATTHFSADLVAFALPPAHVALGRQSPPFVGSNTMNYVGLPLIVLMCAFLWQRRRSTGAWLLCLIAVIAAALSLGSWVHFRGAKTALPGPWLVLSHLPVLRYVIPQRFALFVILPAAMIVAIWLSVPVTANARGVARVGLAILAIACIVPNVGSSTWNTPIRDPAFFATGEYRHYLTRGERVLTVPPLGPNQRWQAKTGFYFKLVGGYGTSSFPAAYTRYPTWNTLLTARLTNSSAAELRRFLTAKGAEAIVVDETYPGPWPRLFATLGIRPLSTGGVLLYRLRKPA
jgi:hypothetical protein